MQCAGGREGAVAAGLPPPEAALARGMVLGQDEAIDETTRQDWRDSGLSHLLAVSGQNVMLLVALAMPLLALVRAGPVVRGTALLALIALYVPLAGAGPSLQRAGVMGAAGIAAMTLSRPASRWYALLLAATATLALNPRVSADPGWQLSFAAVAGILAVGRPLGAALARAARNSSRSRPGPGAAAAGVAAGTVRAARALVRGFAEGVAITLAATLATGPLVAFHFGAVPLAGLLANLLALPAVAPAMWLGMVKAALGIVGGALPPAGEVAELLGPLTRIPLAYLEGLAERCAGIQGSRLALPLHSAGDVTAAYLLIAAARPRRPAGRAPQAACRPPAGLRRAGRRLAARPALLPRRGARPRPDRPRTRHRHGARLAVAARRPDGEVPRHRPGRRHARPGRPRRERALRRGPAGGRASTGSSARRVSGGSTSQSRRTSRATTRAGSTS